MNAISTCQEFYRLKKQKSLVVAAFIVRNVHISSLVGRRESVFFRFITEGPLGSWEVCQSFRELCVFAEYLDEIFPIEAGLRGERRSLPILKLSKFHRLMGKRRRQLYLEAKFTEFFKKLLQMPPFISRSRYIIDFLLPWDDFNNVTYDDLPRGSALSSEHSRQSSLTMLSLQDSFDKSSCSPSCFCDEEGDMIPIQDDEDLEIFYILKHKI